MIELKSETLMKQPITIVYDWLYNEPFGGSRESYTATTYEDYHRIVRILHENKDKYKVVSVTVCHIGYSL